MRILNTNGEYNVNDLILFDPFRIKHFALSLYYLCWQPSPASMFSFHWPIPICMNPKRNNFCAFSWTSWTEYVLEMDTSLPCTVYTLGYRSLSPCSRILTSRLIYCSQHNTTYIIIYMILLKFVFVQLLLLLLLLIVIIWIYFCCTGVFLCSPLQFLFLI